MDRCPICIDDIADDLLVTPCNHRFHGKCLKEWHKHQLGFPTCPLCSRFFFSFLEEEEEESGRFVTASETVRFTAWCRVLELCLFALPIFFWTYLISFSFSKFRVPITCVELWDYELDPELEFSWWPTESGYYAFFSGQNSTVLAFCRAK